MSAPAKNVPTVYPAPCEAVNATGVRLVDIRQFRPEFGAPFERAVYEGTEAALIDAGLIPPAMFAAVSKSGKKSAWLEYPDGQRYRVELAKRAGGLWRAQRRYPLG